MINIIKCNNFVLLTNINVTFINYQEFKSETMNLRRKSKAEAEKQDVYRISATISNQNITDFQEDAQGYIWIGTTRGLNRFNAHEYRQYYSSNDSLQLPGDRIQDIFMDSRKRLWIATTNGTCRYTDQDNFCQIPINVCVSP